MTTFIIASLLFAAYIGTAVWLFGIPASLSETYYLYRDRFGARAGYIFPAFMVIFCGLLMPSVLQITDGSDFQFIGFLMLASLLFVAAAPCFKDDSQSKVHTGAAYVSAAAGIAFSIAFGGWVYIAFFGLITAGLCVRRTYSSAMVFFLEMGAFCSVIMTLLG